MAPKQDWFRNTKWDASIAEAFHAKLARARTQRDQYLVIQAMTLVYRHPKAALALTDLFLETGSKHIGGNMLRGLEVRARALGELKNVKAFKAAYHEFLQVEKTLPNLKGLTPFYFPIYVARLKITDQYDLALEKCQAAADIFGSPKLAFLKTGARALIYWELGRKDEARINADMAVRFGKIRKRGLSVAFDKSVIEFNDASALKRLLAILRWTTKP